MSSVGLVAVRGVAAVGEITSSSVCGTRRATARICSSVPYSSSSPCTASTGQRIVSDRASMFQARNAGSSQMSFQPRNAESGVGVVARQLLAQVGRSRRRRARRSMLATETSSTNTCGATATTPATGCRAAWSSAIDAAVAVAEEPGPLDAERREQRGQHLVRLVVHEVGRPALVGGLGVERP